MKRNLLKFLIGLAIGAFFVWLSAKDWPLQRLTGHATLTGSTLTVGTAATGWSLDLLWLLPYLALLIGIHVLRVVRWKPLLDPIAPISLADHNRIGAVGFMAMFLFPLRLGELVRPFLVKRLTRDRGRTVRMSEILPTVVVERVTDGLVVSLLLFIVLFFLPEDRTHSGPLTIGAFIALAVFLAATLLLAGARWRPNATHRFITRTAGLLSARLAATVHRILNDFLGGLARLPSPRPFLAFLAMTLVYWALNGLGVWCMVEAFALPVDALGAFAMMAAAVVGMMIPNSPGNVGSFWYFLCLPATLYGVSTDTPQVIAFGLAVWLMQLLQQTLFGLWFIALGRVSWRGVVAATTESDLPLADETLETS